MSNTRMNDNAAGRLVPARVNQKPEIPYAGIGKHIPGGNKKGPPIPSASDYPPGGDKRVGSLRQALEKNVKQASMRIIPKLALYS